ncbi:Tn3 family transposase [Streptomyces sp. NBC_01336]|uniref:Tn3 family transposase n=1 Tax=Streptomyces sp. NBC_01336 TaxID=2903829 RepID=UPI003FCEC43F
MPRSSPPICRSDRTGAEPKPNGAVGGIAHHHVPDPSIALFTHFVPCGAREAVYIMEGLLKNTSEVRPTPRAGLPVPDRAHRTSRRGPENRSRSRGIEPRLTGRSHRTGRVTSPDLQP